MTYKAGIDIGSTTAKMVVFDENRKMIFSTYTRHNAEVKETLHTILETVNNMFGDIELSIAITGTAGMGISEKTGISFIQEVIASSTAIRKIYPYCRTLIDIGGEDAKIIFFDDNFKSDIRMNGNCAGGTGAFIDQMATLLNVQPSDLSTLASNSGTVYPMASRCGVFAKTDVQTLISRDIPKEDIAKSIFNAVAFQTINTLAKGFKVHPKIIFTGGPLTFLPELKKAFLSVLGCSEEDTYHVDRAELIAAIGVAYSEEDDKSILSVKKLMKLVANIPTTRAAKETDRKPLFESKKDFNEWNEKHKSHKVGSVSIDELYGARCFLGIDSGSTTTKIVLIDSEGRVAAKNYRNNNGNPIKAVKDGLQEIARELGRHGVHVYLARCAVTGYGEDVIKAAFAIDEGVVETLAHYRAAKAFDKDVSFILDIGGQDMKAIFIKHGIIENIEINEACSSGCGSFIETFAKGMGYTTPDFAVTACDSLSPCDLGTRCTVFMNSRVKQSLREGSSISDISAGLAMSVVRNCFTKVLKISDVSVLGDHIVVQGGTFKNHAVLRSVEQFLGKDVIRPDISELMGAYGCALYALDAYNTRKEHTPSTFVGFDKLEEALTYERKQLTCKGCENNCTITRMKFQGEHIFYTGNKCEKIYSNKGKTEKETGEDITKKKLELLFDRPFAPTDTKSKIIIGIPRVLNMYQNFPFWATIFTECGFQIKLSSQSSMTISEKGSGTVMSDNICFPAKIANGHIYDLIESNVDRIFYPSIILEEPDSKDAVNSFNCPVVTGYPDVIDSAINPSVREGVPFDAPTMSFVSDKVLFDGCEEYFVNKLGVAKNVLKAAFKKALLEQKRIRVELYKEAKRIIAESKKTKKPIVLLIGRPYHIDPLINHKIPEIITSFGINVLTEDVIENDLSLNEVQVLTQWAYPNRMYKAALWAAQEKDIHVEVVQINSFGCGPDATTIDEIKSLLNAYDKNPTLIRVDEITSPGSVRLRLRSLIESMKMKKQNKEEIPPHRLLNKIFMPEDKKKLKVIGPMFSPFYSPMIESLIKKDYDFETLPPPDIESVEYGLRYANHDICYPATVVIGDVVKALKSGRYDIKNTAAAISQTGGQCRASNYAFLMKRALVNAGFSDVPVVTIGLRTINKQPGFKISKLDLAKEGLVALPYADAIASMYYYTAVREVKKGETKALADKYVAMHPKDFSKKKTDKLLKQAVKEFNNIEIYPYEYPIAGLVGEIYVKYNDFSNNYSADWLMSRGIEVSVPPLLDFFIQKVISIQVNKKHHTRKVSAISYYGAKIGEKLIDYRIDEINNILVNFKGFRPFHHIGHIAENAEKVVALTNQFGEAWLLPGEIATFAEEGINNVLCLQPFGCIANHIIARGIETRIKEKYPDINLLYLDMDAGISEVNTVNRLEFFARAAKDALRQDIITSSEAIKVII